jgi:4,5-dihydroxyphthalate decarboxylase
MSAAALTLKTLLGNYPNTQALLKGSIQPKTFLFDFADVKVPNRAFKRVVRELEFDVAEIALVTFFQAKAYGKPLSLIPATTGAGRFQHHCLVYNVERSHVTVAQLAGKRIGIRAHAQTTITWVRGVLAQDYGVPLDQIQWITFEDGHLAEFPDPASFERAPTGKSMVDMLLAGEIDAAIIGSDLPDDPRLRSVLPDPHSAAQAWGARHQMVPINHMVVMKTGLMLERPNVTRELYSLMHQSKALATSPDTADTKAMGMDLTPFGIAENRRALELLLHYAHEQRLIPRLYDVEELFADFITTTRD